MSRDELLALRDARGYASAGRIRISWHARERMRERGATYADVRRALVEATECRDQRRDADRNAPWCVRGSDAAGQQLRLVVTFDGAVEIVTVLR